MKKFLLIISSIIAGIVIGVAGTILINSQQPERSSNFTVHTTNSATKAQNVNYSSDRLPAIRVSQATAVQRFKSLYSSAEIKSISLTLKDNIYLYNIEGYDSRKDCSIQIDATNNQILGQSTQILDYDYDEEAALNLDKTISRNQANDIAKKEIGGGTPILWELADDNDQAIWKIHLVHHGEKRTVKINAKNGDII